MSLASRLNSLLLFYFHFVITIVLLGRIRWSETIERGAGIQTAFGRWWYNSWYRWWVWGIYEMELIRTFYQCAEQLTVSWQRLDSCLQLPRIPVSWVQEHLEPEQVGTLVVGTSSRSACSWQRQWDLECSMAKEIRERWAMIVCTCRCFGTVADQSEQHCEQSMSWIAKH